MYHELTYPPARMGEQPLMVQILVSLPFSETHEKRHYPNIQALQQQNWSTHCPCLIFSFLWGWNQANKCSTGMAILSLNTSTYSNVPFLQSFGSSSNLCCAFHWSLLSAILLSPPSQSCLPFAATSYPNKSSVMTCSTHPYSFLPATVSFLQFIFYYSSHFCTSFLPSSTALTPECPISWQVEEHIFWCPVLVLPF